MKTASVARSSSFLANEWDKIVGEDMAEENAEKKPEGPGGVGMEKPETAGAEVVGKGRMLLYTCFNDGAGNYVDPSWKWFTCWRCGSLKYI